MLSLVFWFICIRPVHFQTAGSLMPLGPQTQSLHIMQVSPFPHSLPLCGTAWLLPFPSCMHHMGCSPSRGNLPLPCHACSICRPPPPLGYMHHPAAVQAGFLLCHVFSLDTSASPSYHGRSKQGGRIAARKELTGHMLTLQGLCEACGLLVGQS